MLHEFITVNRDEIVRRCRVKVAARSVRSPEEADSHHGVPMFLDQLADALRGDGASTGDIARSATLHGHELLLREFTVSEVVHGYGDVCQSVTELAVETNATITTDDFRRLNLCLDDAIAGAVTEFGRAQNRSTLDGEAARGNERAGFLAHEMRNLLNTALVAFEVLKTGDVGVSGSTGGVLQRSLIGACALARRSLAGVRLAEGGRQSEQFAVAQFIEEIVPAAEIDGDARGIALRVMPVDEGILIEGDRQLLAAVLMNLLQNAFKFTRPHSAVTLTVGASNERVVIEVRDECGGLPGRNIHELFRSFEQRGADRTGSGLGLAFSREAVEANNGRLYARDLPGEGCIFVVDLPRVPVTAAAIA